MSVGHIPFISFITDKVFVVNPGEEDIIFVYLIACVVGVWLNSSCGRLSEQSSSQRGQDVLQRACWESKVGRIPYQDPISHLTWT